MIIIVGRINVTTAGTPVQITASSVYQAALTAAGLSTAFKTVQAILIQAWQGNTGKIYVGKQTLNKTTGVDVGNILVAPSASSIPSFGAANQMSAAGVDVDALWLDADTNGEGVLVTLLVS